MFVLYENILYSFPICLSLIIVAISGAQAITFTENYACMSIYARLHMNYTVSITVLNTKTLVSSLKCYKVKLAQSEKVLPPSEGLRLSLRDS